MGYVVIDKSYLQKVVNSASLNILAATNSIVVTDILMYEITSSEDKSSSRSCLKKLLEIKESAVFMQHSGGLVKNEIVNKRPCYPFSETLISRQIYPGLWTILNKLLNEDPMEHVEADRLNKEYSDFYEKENVERIKKIGNDFSRMFPELIGYKPGSKTVDIDAIKREIASCSSRIKQFIAHAKFLIDREGSLDTFEPSEYVDERWLYLRTFQTSLIYYATYVERYGDEAGNVVSSKLPHDSVDLEYCICGIHAGKVATGDKMIRDIFSYFQSPDNCFYK